MSPTLLEDDIELIALALFESMGWTWMDCFEERLHSDGLVVKGVA